MEIKQNKAVIQAQGYIISEQTLLEKKNLFFVFAVFVQ